MVRKEQTHAILGVLMPSGEKPVPKEALVEMQLTGFPKNITPGNHMLIYHINQIGYAIESYSDTVIYL